VPDDDGADAMFSTMAKACKPSMDRLFRDIGFWAPELFNERLIEKIGDMVFICAQVAVGRKPDGE
jgi:hypothetical protein